MEFFTPLTRRGSVEVISDIELCEKPDYFRKMRRKRGEICEDSSIKECVLYRSSRIGSKSPEEIEKCDVEWERNKLVVQNGILSFYAWQKNYSEGMRLLKFNRSITRVKEVRYRNKGALLISAFEHSYLLRSVSIRVQKNNG